MPPATLHLISSMATRLVLTELTASHEAMSGVPTRLEAVGGVDAARRVQAGEAFDLIVLAAGAMQTLAAEGHTRPGSLRGLVNSGMSVAVRAGSPRPDIGNEAALKEAVLAARTIGYSTGPSGTHLLKTFERWGVLDTLRDRLVQATPGVPVASMVADGRVALGFQQLSELLHVPGIEVLGPLPEGVQLMTTFSAAVATRSTQPDAAAALIDFMTSPAATAAKQRQGMEPA